MPYKDNEVISLTPYDNKLVVKYSYNSYYDRLDIVKEQKKLPEDTPEIACPYCYSTSFAITYITRECIANCECGHDMTIYAGN